MGFQKKFGAKPSKSFGSRGGSRDGGLRGSRGGFSSEAFGGRSKSRDSDGPRSRGGFESKSFERRPSRGGPELFDTVCEKCGKDTQVPFKPTGGKPVYCRDCFNKNDSSSDRPTRTAPRGGDDLAEINRKLDKIMRALKID